MNPKRHRLDSPAIRILCRRILLGALMALALASAQMPAAAAAPVASSEPITVFVARKIITMEPSLPEAKVVAVRGGRVLALGQNLAELAPWTQTPKGDLKSNVEIDRQFSKKTLFPGFIDPHLHPMMAAVLLPTHFITPEDWNLPRGEFKGVRTPEAFRAALRRAITDSAVTDGPFISWGYHGLWHGPLDRAALDAMAPERPVVVWHRSFHEIVANTPAMKLIGLATPEALAKVLAATPGTDPSHADFEAGHLSETALRAALGGLAPYILAPEHLQAGLESLRKMMLGSGVTTIADMATGIFLPFETEAKMISRAFEGPKAPARVLLVPTAINLIESAGSAEAGIAYLRKVAPELRSRRIWLDDRVKVLADGAFFSQYMRMNPPGYTDGHEGKWLMPPETLEAVTRVFWEADFAIHCHVNGDEGLDVVLDMLESFQRETPRPDPRFTLEHLGYSTEAQNRRIATLGALVSAQPNYLYLLGRKYGEQGLGYDRASQISRLGSLERKNVTLALHSDSTMAPVDPLFLAWVAATRQNIDGGVLAPNERLSLDKALRAITIDAAYVLGLEAEVGSIAAGKRADFAVLEKDPYRMGASKLKDIPVWGVVFEGEPTPAR